MVYFVWSRTHEALPAGLIGRQPPRPSTSVKDVAVADCGRLFGAGKSRPAIAGNLRAEGDNDKIGCPMVAEGVVQAERNSPEVHDLKAFTFCLLKAA